MSAVHRIVLLVGSARPEGQSTSESLGRYLLDRIDPSIARDVFFVSHVHKGERLAEFLSAVDAADLVILCTPLYIDSLPALVVRAFEHVAARRSANVAPRPSGFLAIVNCGFPEAEQCRTALDICRVFSDRAGLHWLGGLALGGGEAIAGKALDDAGGVAHHVRVALEEAAAAIAHGDPIPDSVVAMMAKTAFPAALYIMAGNVGWIARARKHGAWRHLGARPYA